MPGCSWGSLAWMSAPVSLGGIAGIVILTLRGSFYAQTWPLMFVVGEGVTIKSQFGIPTFSVQPV